MKRALLIGFMLSIILSSIPESSIVYAQEEQLVAAMEVISPGVEFKRENTDVWIPVRQESLVSEGDSIRTDDEGSALVTFFEDGSFVQLEPNSEIVIVDFVSIQDNPQLTLEVLAGITRQQFQQILDPNNRRNYRVVTPGINMTVRGTTFDVRVEDDGRSALITSDGEVRAEQESVTQGFGVRAEADGELSDVVPAASFEELDAALDGCDGSATLTGDILYIVRSGPNDNNPIIETIAPNEVEALFGTDETGDWYRIQLSDDQFGWVSADLIESGTNCDGLRVFERNFSE